MNKLAKLAADKDSKSAQKYPEGSFLAGGLPKNQVNALSQAATPPAQPEAMQNPPVAPPSAMPIPAQQSSQQGAQLSHQGASDETGINSKTGKPWAEELNNHLEEASKVEGRYNGEVQYEGDKINIRGGFAKIGNEVFMVSDDGRIVANKDHQFIGTIKDGKFIKSSPEMINQFQHEGLLGKPNEQPKGNATR
jgi:hypothetical protein